jgi:hypothetical protein
MRFKIFLAALTTVGAVVAGSIAGPAAAATNCSGSQVFAPWGDNASYIQMNSVAGTTGQLGGSTSAVYGGYCTSVVKPQIRLFAKNSGGWGTLTVSVQYKDTAGVKHDDVIGTLNGSGSWPSQIMTYGAAAGNIQVTVTAHGGNWQVAGVFLDPFCAR